MAFKFGLENWRRLKNVPLIDLKPITILVGRNSSGKSSYLRALPLLKQSVMKRLSSPILWYGDYVDFGSFKGTISEGNTSQNIILKFGIDRLIAAGATIFYSPEQMLNRPTREYTDIVLNVGISGDEDSARIASIDLSLKTIGVRYIMNVGISGQLESLTLNGSNISSLFGRVRLVISPGSVFPDVFIYKDEQHGSLPRNFQADEQPAFGDLASFISPMLDRRIKRSVLFGLINDFLMMENFDAETLLSLANRTSVKSWKRLLTEVATGDNSELYQKFWVAYFASQFFTVLRRVNSSLQQTISNVLYIGPARARSERYYRYQELAVTEIDSNGENFAMFLNSLSAEQLTSLSDWIESLYGYRIELTRTSSHISISLREAGSETNVVDTGYGISQILPVLGQIWWAANRNRRTTFGQRDTGASLLAIEQPELHLHPAHQAYLADALVDVPYRRSTAKRSKTHFIIETHSETLVNRLGQLVYDKRLQPSDVQVLIFEPDSNDVSQTNVLLAQFGAKGELINWPYGFFQAGA